MPNKQTSEYGNRSHYGDIKKAKNQKFTDAELLTALELSDHNVTEAARILGVNRKTVVERRKKLPALLSTKDSVENYKEKRADIMAQLQSLVLQHITPDKLRKASVQQLAMIFGIFYDKERLERGKPTSYGVAASIQKMHPEDIKLIKQLIKQSTERKLKASRQLPVAESEVAPQVIAQDASSGEKLKLVK